MGKLSHQEGITSTKSLKSLVVRYQGVFFTRRAFDRLSSAGVGCGAKKCIYCGERRKITLAFCLSCPRARGKVSIKKMLRGR